MPLYAATDLTCLILSEACPLLCRRVAADRWMTPACLAAQMEGEHWQF